MGGCKRWVLVESLSKQGQCCICSQQLPILSGSQEIVASIIRGVLFQKPSSKLPKITEAASMQIYSCKGVEGKCGCRLPRKAPLKGLLRFIVSL